MRGCRGYVRAMFDLILPRTCAVCGRRLHVSEDHLCLYCLSDIPLTRFWTMSRNPMADRFNAVLQKGLEAAWDEEDTVISPVHEQYVYATSLFYYDTESEYRHISYQIKYHGNIRLGKYFGRMLGRKLAEAEWSAGIDLIIPVPLHWRRKWSRGYNQAEVIASEVATVMMAPIRTDLLKRIRYTETQTRMETADKATNVADAFKAESLPVGVKHILLVDDVFTTGSTLHSCFLALRDICPPSVRISIATLGFVGG